MDEERSRMRKVVVEFDPACYEKLGAAKIFETVKAIEFRQILRLDFEEGTKILVEDIEMKPGFVIEDMDLPEGIEILNILKREGNRYTVLMKAEADIFVQRQLGLDWQQAKTLPALADAEKLFSADFRILPDPPILISEERAMFGFLGDKESIEIMLNLLRFLVDVKSVSFPRMGPYEYDVLSALTQRQREALAAAQKYGYYAYPRRISTEELARKMGLTKTTLIEHLRKAENALVSSLIPG
jgi:hypothetical protein